MNDSDVLIKIITAFEAGGIEAAKKAAQELKAQMGDAAGGSDMLKKAMEALSGKGKQAGDTLRGLYGLMTKDGSAAVADLGKTVQGLAQTFGLALGPAGAIASIAMAGFQVVKGIMDQHKQAAEEAAKAAREAAEKDAEAAKKHLEELDKVRLEAINGAVAQLKEGLDSVAKAAEASRKNLDAMEDSQLGVDTAEIDAKVAAGEMTAEEGEHAKAKLRFDAADRKDQREMDALQAEQDRLTEADAEAAKAAEEAENALSDAAKELKSATDRLTIERRKLSKNPENVEQAQRVIDAQARRDAAASAIEAAGVKKQAADAAAQAAVDARFDRGAEITQRQQILQNSMTARSHQRSAEGSKYESKQQEARLKEQEEQRKKDAEAWAEYDKAQQAKASTPGYLAREVSAMVGRGQRDKQGQLYDVDVDGGAVRRQAMGTLKAAVDSAVASKGGDAEEAGILAQAVDALESMGANLRADKAQINAKLQELVNSIQKVESQVKHGRS